MDRELIGTVNRNQQLDVERHVDNQLSVVELHLHQCI